MQDQINEIQASVNRIEDAIAGNKLGTDKGLAHRMSANEMTAYNNKKEITKIKGKSVILGTSAGGLFVGLVEAIKHFFITGGTH